MTDPAAPRRILVTLDEPRRAAAALATAVRLAEGMQSALEGVFIEDEGLFHAAELPFTREVPASGSEPRPLAADRLARSMATRAEELRAAMAEAVGSRGVAWRFQVVRTRSPGGLVAAVGAYDVLFVAGAGRSGPRGAVMVWYDGTPVAGRALEVGGRLAALEGRPLMVVLPETDGPVLREGAAAHLQGTPASFTRVAPAGLGTDARRLGAALLVVAGDSGLFDPGPTAERLHAAAGCPVVLVA